MCSVIEEPVWLRFVPGCRCAFIFDHRQGVSIIDLGKTHEALSKACAFLEETVASGGNVLFVGTKRQAKEIVREAATSLNMPMCVDRWLGGTLTNYETVKKSVAKFKKYQAMETSGEMAKLPRKEESAIKREMTRMQKNFSGISDMGGLPSAMFVVDVNHHKIAVAEAARSGIACVGIVDTNSDPTTVSHPIPGNDDAVKSIRNENERYHILMCPTLFLIVDCRDMMLSGFGFW